MATTTTSEFPYDETKPSSSVWGQPEEPSAAPPSLAEVMSEQLAKDLAMAENKFPMKTDDDEEELDPETENVLKMLQEEDSCKDDFLIAQMLQMQFDNEYDEVLKHEERHYNGTSKVSVSYSKYKVVPDNPIWKDDSDEEYEDDVKREIDHYEANDRDKESLPKCGYKKVGDVFVTKHDKEVNQRFNAKRIMEFPPGIETGDGGGFDMQLSNQVYNKIRNFSVKEGKRKARIHDKEEKATASEAVDPKTRLILYKMVNGEILDAVNGVISTGKEAVIMHADGGPGRKEADEPMNVPKECAVKVFKTTLNEFKNREKYIKDDYRFKNRFSKQNPRKVIHMWAEKELHNLMKMARFGVRVPDVVVLKQHVLVMSFIGRDGTPAPKLKDAEMSSDDLVSAYSQILEMMKTLYDDCHLVHADLSEYNILWHDKQCWFIDVSQSVEPNHPHGLEFLMRDCLNIVRFFSDRNVPNCHESGQALFNEITDLKIEDGDVFRQVRDYEKTQELMKIGATEDHFDYCWERTKTEPTPPKPIPGRSGSSSGKSGGKRSARSPKSPSGKSPKSYGSATDSPGKHLTGKFDFVSMTDEELRDLKEKTEESSKRGHVTFNEDFPPL